MTRSWLNLPELTIAGAAADIIIVRADRPRSIVRRRRRGAASSTSSSFAPIAANGFREKEMATSPRAAAPPRRLNHMARVGLLTDVAELACPPRARA